MTEIDDAPSEAERFWEDRYRSTAQVWSGRVNAILAEVVTPLPPGRALDLGCGEGGDVVWLACRGWHVTGVDISLTALRRTVEHATAAGVADLVTVRRRELGKAGIEGEFDLVSAQFLQSPVELLREEVLRGAAGAVATGGLLLIVEHGSVPSWSQHHDHVFPTPQETLDVLDLDDGWDVVRLDAPRRDVIGPEGQEATILDNVVAVRRR